MKLVNASLFQKDMESAKLPEEQKLKKFRVTYSGSDIIEAIDEEDAITKCMEQLCIPDMDFNTEGVAND